MRRPYCVPDRPCTDESPDFGRSRYFRVFAMVSVINRSGLPRLRLRRATRARVGASRARHGTPRQSRGCAPLRAGRPRSQGTAALSGDGCAPRERLRSQGTAALPGNGCALRGRLRSQGTCVCQPDGRARAPRDARAPRERLRSQGTAALPGNVCVPAGRPRSRPTGRPRSQGTAALSGDGCAPRGRLRSQGTAARADRSTRTASSNPPDPLMCTPRRFHS